MSTKKRISNKSINTKIKNPNSENADYHGLHDGFYGKSQYHIIRNQSLDISLLSKLQEKYKYIPEKYNYKYIPDEYLQFIKKCYKINNSIFPYKIINNNFHRNLPVRITLEYYLCNTGYDSPLIEDKHEQPFFAITILYFHNVPEEIGFLELILLNSTNIHIIKSGTCVIINSGISYKLRTEKKLKHECKLPVIEFNGSREYPLSEDIIINYKENT